MEITQIPVKNVLTRASGWLRAVTSHSAQPYVGCAFGKALCGVGCYVRHNAWVTKGRSWGSFVDIRGGAAESYRDNVARERRWARSARGRFSIFLSSSTEPFQPEELRTGITRSLLEAMLEEPPDELVLQSHSHRAADYLPLYVELAKKCELRVHLSIETDREKLEGLPPHASSVEARFAAAARLKAAGIRTVVTVSPLLPIAEPAAFFRRIAETADAVVLDHFIGGDGSLDGCRTRATLLPQVLEALEPESVTLAYRDRMAREAAGVMPGRVGIGCGGFAGRFPL